MNFWLSGQVTLFDATHRYMPAVQAEHITWSPDGRAAVRLAGMMPAAKEILLDIDAGQTLYLVHKCSGVRDVFSDDGVIVSLHILKSPRFKFEYVPALSPSEDEVVKMIVLLQCQIQIGN